MNFFEPDAEELALGRPDPLLWEQELDVRPAVAESLERALGFRAGRTHWRSDNDHLYAIELADTGRGRPTSATVFGYWDRWEPRPPEHEIDQDLLTFLAWFAGIADSMDPANLASVASRAGIAGQWPEGSVLRTPDERFADLRGFAYEPCYVEVEGLRMAYVELGDPDADPILCLHGEPTWGYLYRFMAPVLAQAGRVIIPDLVGFGRSDKPVAANAYTYRSQARRVRRFVEALDLWRITLFCQDWGGLLGLRVLSERPDRFARLVATNTGLPTGEGSSGDAFLAWRRFSQAAPLDVGALMRLAVRRGLSDAEASAYAAPFPGPEYLQGVHRFPILVPSRHDHPGAYENRQAAARLARLTDLPVYLPWGRDPITRGWLSTARTLFPQATVEEQDNEGHFIQDELGADLAELVVSWMAGN